MKDIPLRFSWQQRAKFASDKEYIHKCFKAYHVPTPDAVCDFISRWCLTYDPRRKTDKVLPFELFPKQEEYVHWLWERYKTDTSGVVDKCRTAGASWVTMAFFTYMLVFQKDVSLQIYTFKAEACDKIGDISSLMQKSVFILKHLPAEFRQGIRWTHMYIQNDSNGSDLAGSSGDNPGRSGRRTMVARDEEAFYQNAEGIEAALSETSNCHISISTHQSTNTLFYRKCQSGMPRFVFDWTDDPRLDQEWYDTKKAEAESKGLMHVFEREINRNAAASIDSVVVPSSWVESSKRCKIKHSGRIIAGLDPMDEGGDLHGFVVVHGSELIYAQESGEGDPGDAVDLFFWKAVDLGVEEFRYDPLGVGAGAKVRIKEIKAKVESDSDISAERKKKILDMKIVPWAASGKVIRAKEIDYQDKKNGELFENAKAQAWWKVREEFRNTFRYVNEKDHDESQLIHFPTGNDRAINKLIQELSQPQFKLSASGKIVIDKKPKGTPSPNLADAYVMCRAETTPTWISWDSV